MLNIPINIYFTLPSYAYAFNDLLCLKLCWHNRWVSTPCLPVVTPTSDELYGLYLLHHANGQMYVCLITLSIKIINKCNVFPCTDSSQLEWFHAETFMHVLEL